MAASDNDDSNLHRVDLVTWLVIAIGYSGSFLLLATWMWMLYRTNIQEMQIMMHDAVIEINELKANQKLMREDITAQKHATYALNNKVTAMTQRQLWFTQRILEADEVWVEALKKGIDAHRDTR